jgi:hypothetical protein
MFCACASKSPQVQPCTLHPWLPARHSWTSLVTVPIEGREAGLGRKHRSAIIASYKQAKNKID